MKIILLGEAMGLFMAEETGPLSQVERFRAAIAGAEYNVAVGLARLGHEPAYCTRLGGDPMGLRIREGMAANHIDQSLCLEAPGELTGFMLKGSTLEGDPDIAYYRKGSAASRITAHDIDKLDLFGCGRLHMTGIFPALSDSALAAAKRLASRARALDLPISFDPNLRPQLWPGEKEMVRTLNGLAEGVETILPGIGEGKTLTGQDTPEGVADYYHSMGVKNVLVKLGGQGSFWSVKGGGSGYAPAVQVTKVVDTVGAGDGFAAGVVSALAEGLSLPEANRRGLAIGAIQVSHKSDNEGLPTREQLEEVLRAGRV
ncbi:sugar kinase [Oscillospiraceae bacterium 42-9]